MRPNPDDGAPVVESTAVVTDEHADLLVMLDHLDIDVIGVGMAAALRERFLDDPVDGRLEVRVSRRALARPDS